MGNDGHSIETETAPGRVEHELDAARRARHRGRHEAADVHAHVPVLRGPVRADDCGGQPASTSTAFASTATSTWISASKLPFDLKMTYMRDVKSGYRGQRRRRHLQQRQQHRRAARVVERSDAGLRLPGRVDQGVGQRARGVLPQLVQQPAGNDDLRQSAPAVRPGVHRGGRCDSGPGRPGIGPSHRSAGQLGGHGRRPACMLKFGKQTRITADVAFGQWNQNAQIYPYTINSTILTTAGVPANTTAALDKQSLDGKIDTTTLNFGFSSRPIDGLGRAGAVPQLRHRQQDADVRAHGQRRQRPGSELDGSRRSGLRRRLRSGGRRPIRTATDRAGSTLQASYDIKDLTIEGTYRNIADRSDLSRGDEGRRDGRVDRGHPAHE